ncbi:hypothetical protein CYMTET_19099 [Cymbomonas tetramitiformis]|uniref:UBZ4-type domain-containing protein n=1 Tax=Cymbomonas tetramitiformis TaxID=36881 RepID=A0AAE0G6P4_9CHLO|nr:hypothetical protein CYMTET_19099 [Cymbomonas tetramitiformis]
MPHLQGAPPSLGSYWGGGSSRGRPAARPKDDPIERGGSLQDSRSQCPICTEKFRPSALNHEINQHIDACLLACTL